MGEEAKGSGDCDSGQRASRPGTCAAAAGSFLAFVSLNGAAGCCGVLPGLAGLAGVLGLAAGGALSVQLPLLYGGCALVLTGTALSFRRHRKRGAMLLAAAAIPALVIPFQFPMDVALFRLSVYGGITALLLAAGIDLFLLRRSRSCRAHR